jgi:hypothetical protein
VTDQTVNQDNAGKAPPEEKPKAGAENRTFSQDELNEIIEARLAREKQKYSDYDDLRAAAQRLKDIEDGQLSEQEKLQRQLDEFRTRAEAAEQRYVTNEVKVDFADKAQKAGIVDIKAAWTLAQADKLHGEYDAKADGVSDHDFDELKKRYPYLFTGVTRGAGSIDGAAGVRSAGMSMNEWIRQQAKR